MIGGINFRATLFMQNTRSPNVEHGFTAGAENVLKHGLACLFASCLLPVTPSSASGCWGVRVITGVNDGGGYVFPAFHEGY